MERKLGIFSEARFKVLRALYLSKDGVSLREIAYRTGLSVGPVQVATTSLVRRGTIEKKADSGRTVFTLNQAHPEAPAIISMLETLIRSEIRAQRMKDSAENVNLLHALNNLYKFSNKLKGTTGGLRAAF